MVFNGGPASFLCAIPAKTQTNLGYLFFIEFFVDSYIVSSCLHCHRYGEFDGLIPFRGSSSGQFSIQPIHS